MYKFEIRKKFVYGLTGNRIKFSEVLASWRPGWPSRGFVDLRFCNRKCNCAIRGAGELDKSWARTGSRKCWSTSTSSCSRPSSNAASLSPSYVARSRWCWPRTAADLTWSEFRPYGWSRCVPAPLGRGPRNGVTDVVSATVLVNIVGAVAPTQHIR